MTRRLAIRQTLSSRAFDGKVRTFSIANSERDAVAVAEIKLSQIAVQMLL